MSKSLKYRKAMNMMYSFGASIVIIGALFKILHFKIGPLTGGLMLGVGLITEAFIFAVSAFEPIPSEYDWTLVYPELAGGEKKPKSKEIEKVEQQTKEIVDELEIIMKHTIEDVAMLRSLSSQIFNLKDVVTHIQPSLHLMNESNEYVNNINIAAAKLESLNSLYQLQFDKSEKQNELNLLILDNIEQISNQMKQITDNLNSMNTVYGEMLEVH
ncbi:type IX secretion system motor protein PorL/GldL [Aureivirga marina]|uniref:type IX secretion system motor protein PorL/GldL n=1 Tax=Aureivirga marina TaxID=1182451 RepID=UPI0018CBCEE7|nr:gliding motility protein GldL [Aureivirga marina]